MDAISDECARIAKHTSNNFKNSKEKINNRTNDCNFLTGFCALIKSNTRLDYYH
ncbi:hypothetical protein BAZSYMA_ACONTIG00158_0 [Bathymodiolus azoricus thioautotrophic gill symbiont]|uniref:Uncharacterized protein n=1 Tax=Bathymodiolus azoricus thioautotrophic gill symbiont TaxID=235205 RepID=A0A1H6LC75_9GAMM|nr:hypothetical protein BAZSYMA_ACONTIG00158_0 [Bathymodiolus azoricus thioautotrophic gill symbiont]